jgi:hypothetical protein
VYSVHRLLLPKAGHQPAECEDAIGVRTDLGRMCIADGATEAFDSRTWARLLTKHWVRSTGLVTTDEMEAWWVALGGRLDRRWAQRTLPWYAEEKAAGGAFAAFAGISLVEAADGWVTWEGVALGDACLVHRSATQIVSSLPIGAAEDFGYRPRLVPSAMARHAGLSVEVTRLKGRAAAGDSLLLLTDAIAAWYLTHFESAPELISEFERSMVTGDAGEQRAFVRAERDARRLRNDDVAAVLLRVDGSADRVVG